MNELNKVKQVITDEGRKSGVVVLKILLFGSRTRDDFRPDSDWDFYVVIDKDLPFPERQEMASRIRWSLAQGGVDCDIIIQSDKVMRQRQGNTGYLTYYALKEGVEI